MTFESRRSALSLPHSPYVYKLPLLGLGQERGMKWFFFPPRVKIASEERVEQDWFNAANVKSSFPIGR